MDSHLDAKLTTTEKWVFHLSNVRHCSSNPPIILVCLEVASVSLQLEWTIQTWEDLKELRPNYPFDTHHMHVDRLRPMLSILSAISWWIDVVFFNLHLLLEAPPESGNRNLQSLRSYYLIFALYGWIWFIEDIGRNDYLYEVII